MLATILLLVAGQCGPAGCRMPAPSYVPYQAAPVYFQPAMPAPVIMPSPSPDDIERWKAEGRAEARAEMCAAKKANPCSDRCSCSSCEGGCKCASAPCGESGCRCLTSAQAAPPAAERPTGVEGDRISPTPRYSINGKAVSRDEARWAVEQLADDSSKPHLTVIGDAASRKAMRAALLKDAAVANAVRAQDYDPSAMAVRKHAATGLTVYLQQPDGTNLIPPATSLTAADAPGLLARLRVALGLDAPTPPPAPKPGPASPSGPAGPGFIDQANNFAKANPQLGYGAAAAVALLWFLNRPKQNPVTQ